MWFFTNIATSAHFATTERARSLYSKSTWTLIWASGLFIARFQTAATVARHQAIWRHMSSCIQVTKRMLKSDLRYSCVCSHLSSFFGQEDKPYECPVCHAKFTQNGTMRRHIAKKHENFDFSTLRPLKKTLNSGRKLSKLKLTYGSVVGDDQKWDETLLQSSVNLWSIFNLCSLFKIPITIWQTRVRSGFIEQRVKSPHRPFILKQVVVICKRVRSSRRSDPLRWRTLSWAQLQNR